MNADTRSQGVHLISKMFGLKRDKPRHEKGFRNPKRSLSLFSISGRRNRNEGNKHSSKCEILGGVFHVPQPSEEFVDNATVIIENRYFMKQFHLQESSTRSLSATECSTNHEDLERQHYSSSSSCCFGCCQWASSGSSSHHDGSPLVTRKNLLSHRDFAEFKHLSDDELLGRIMLRAQRTLPKPHPGYRVSNHLMVNTERIKRTCVPLKRNLELDTIARKHAQYMARADKLSYPEPDGLCCGDEDKQRIGVNVGRGSTIKDIHKSMVSSSTADLNNIIDRRFVYMGVGTAKGGDDNDTMYLCQIFSD